MNTDDSDIMMEAVNPQFRPPPLVPGFAAANQLSLNLLLQSEQAKGYGGHLNTMEESKAVLQRLRDKRLELPESCEDFPQEPAKQKALVREIYACITNFDNIIDNISRRGCKDNKERRENTHVTRVKALSPIEIEVLSWEVLDKTRDMQLGLVNLPPWTPDWTRVRYPTFLARLAAVKEALRDSKAAVHGLLEPAFIARLVARPEVEMKRKLSNKSVNALRNKQVHAGIEALKKAGGEAA